MFANYEHAWRCFAAAYLVRGIYTTVVVYTYTSFVVHYFALRLLGQNDRLDSLFLGVYAFEGQP